MAAIAGTTRTDSSMEQAFAADVDIKTAEVGLYLVVAKSDGQAMERSLAAADAAIAARISDTRVLAVMRFRSFEAIRIDPAIDLVGPVSLDPARFEAFQRIVGTQVVED